MFTACTSVSTEKDLSHDGAKTESQDILYFEEEQRLELDEIAAVQGVMDHLFIYTQADAENDTQNFFSYDLMTGEKCKIGSVENFVMSTNPLKFGIHDRQLYFYMRTNQNNQEVTSLYEMDLERQAINVFEQENISGKLSYIATLNENVILSLKSNLKFLKFKTKMFSLFSLFLCLTAVLLFDVYSTIKMNYFVRFSSFIGIVSRMVKESAHI